MLDGEERITYSVAEGNFLASLVSFFKEVPARENIRAGADSELWLIDKPSIARLQRGQGWYAGDTDLRVTVSFDYDGCRVVPDMRTLAPDVTAGTRMPRTLPPTSTTASASGPGLPAGEPCEL